MLFLFHILAEMNSRQMKTAAVTQIKQDIWGEKAKLAKEILRFLRKSSISKKAVCKIKIET